PPSKTSACGARACRRPTATWACSTSPPSTRRPCWTTTTGSPRSSTPGGAEPRSASAASPSRQEPPGPPRQDDRLDVRADASRFPACHGEIPIGGDEVMKGLIMDSPLTLTQLFERSRKLFHKKTMATRVPGHGLQRYTYADYAERVARLAAALARLGIQKGD